QAGAVFEAKFMLPWSFSEEAAAEKYMPQLQHNMWVINAQAAVLSLISGGRQMVRDPHPGRFPLPAPPAHGREKILALRREWRAPSPVWNRAAPPADRSGADRRHERIQCLGGILWRVSTHARGSPRA